jgi:homoserine dehydrogenase
MVNTLKELNKALGVAGDVLTSQTEPLDYQETDETLPIIVENDVEEYDDIEKDYRLQRDTFHTLVEKGSTAIDGILELAKEGEHPRGYEVAGNLIKQVAEVAEKLGDLQEKMKRLKEVPNTAPKNVTNALFVGSTAELQKMLKGKSDG